MSVLQTALKIHDHAGQVAGEAVRRIQTGGNPGWYLERAAGLRAEAYEYFATAEILRPLQDERWAALFPKAGK